MVDYTVSEQRHRPSDSLPLPKEFLNVFKQEKCATSAKWSTSLSVPIFVLSTNGKSELQFNSALNSHCEFQQTTRQNDEKVH